MTCLDDVALERVRMELAVDSQRAHAESCALCRTRLEAMRAEDEDFHRFVFPRTVDAVAKAGRRRPFWPVLFAVVPVAAAVAFGVWHREPSADYVGLKGETVGLAVFTVDASGAPVQLADGASVSASASLRFRVAPSKACHLWLFSLDEQRQVSRLYPPVGPAALVSGATTIPGGATLDGLKGAERIFAFCSATPLDFGELEHRVMEVHTPIRALANVPLEGLQGSVLLEKKP